MTFPPETTEPPNQDSIELTAMKIALADAITKWAQLEDGLALLFAFGLHSPLPCALDIYFAPIGSEIRFNLVDVVVQSLLMNHPQLFQFVPLWKKTLVTLNKARKVRNKIAHGAAVQHTIGKISQVRLTGPTLQGMSERNSQGQFPGMSVHDVISAYWRFSACCTSIQTFAEVAQHLWTNPNDVETFARISLELEVHLTVGSAQLGGPPRPGL